MLKESHSNAPNVYFLIIFFFSFHLWSHVVLAATVGISLVFFKIGDSCQTKINDLNMQIINIVLIKFLVVDDDVVGFNISMVNSTPLPLLDFSLLLIGFSFQLCPEIFFDNRGIKIKDVGMQAIESLKELLVDLVYYCLPPLFFFNPSQQLLIAKCTLTLLKSQE